MRKSNFIQPIMVALLSVAVTFPLTAQDTKPAASAKTEDKKSDDAEMMAKMMELAKPGENHKRMQDRVGTWSYVVKWWMTPEAQPSESTGTSVNKLVMEGRYLIGEHTGKMQMPGAEGKMMDMEFKGMGVEGFDNAKNKFVASWIDNMGTGIMNLEGTYDAANKTITYYADYEPMPGMKTKIRETIRIADRDHHALEFFEDRGGKEVKTMEITYTRKS
jgi:hypothetical protein